MVSSKQHGAKLQFIGRVLISLGYLSIFDLRKLGAGATVVKRGERSLGARGSRGGGREGSISLLGEGEGEGVCFSEGPTGRVTGPCPPNTG